MNLTNFSRTNKERCESPDGFGHAINSWSLSDWITATLGELGEAANIITKLNRHRDGICEPTLEHDLKCMLADELADAFIYLDLLMQAANLDPSEIVRKKFNTTSAKRGYPHRF